MTNNWELVYLNFYVFDIATQSVSPYAAGSVVSLRLSLWEEQQLTVAEPVKIKSLLSANRASSLLSSYVVSVGTKGQTVCGHKPGFFGVKRDTLGCYFYIVVGYAKH